MRKKHSAKRLAAWLAMAAITVTAAAAGPSAYIPTDATGADIWCGTVSDNGLWALSETAGDESVDNPQSTGGTLIEVATGQSITIGAGADGVASVGDVTDDGMLVVGSLDGIPATWSRSTQSWTTLPLPSGYTYGSLLYVTPDGSRAIGYAGKSSDIYAACPVLYDLSTRQHIDLTNLPFFGMNGKTYTQNAPKNLAADGKSFVGMVGESFLMDRMVSDDENDGYVDGYGAVMWAYVYDIEAQTYTPIGWTLDSNNNFTEVHANSNFIDNVHVSPSGEWVTGALRLAIPVSGSDYANDVAVAFRYNTKTGSYEVFDGSDSDYDATGTAIDDAGTLYGCQPWENPYPTALVRQGKYWYSFDDIFSQVYNFNLITAIGENGDVTGRPANVSADGLTMCMINGSGIGYLLKLEENIANGASQVDLLSNFTASPVAGSALSRLKSTSVTFDRQIQLVGNPTNIKVLKSDGSTLISALATTKVLDSDTRTLSISFRTTLLDEGESYTIVIPAGIVALTDDSSVTNKEIRVSYTGRADKAVEIVSVSPANGSAQGFFDASSNPIILTFDCPVKLADSYTVGFYEGTYSTPKTTFTAQLGSDSRIVYLYPTSTQYMFVGSQYRVEVPEGLVTDYSDANPNAALTLTYEGSYERQVQAEGSTLFFADGSVSSYLTWITFDGDENTPATVPASWGFTAAAAWWGVTDDTGDLCFASHSMYTPAGQSDDWMMTPQLLIPDEKCQLSFDAQSYLKSKADYLKVYVYACDEIYNSLDKDLTATIRATADLVFNQQLWPGTSEEDLAGDWEHYVIDLDKYSGKYIYVAFVNDNTDQSAVFVDNVLVGRDLAYTASFRHSSTVVDLDKLTVEGAITITSETETYTGLKLRLLDSDEAEVDALEWANTTYQKGDVQNFSFTKALPLVKGASNTFTLEVTLGEETSTVTETVKDLMFEPTKRVVIEEYTGKSCGNCPLGILAMEKIEATYPGRVVPVILKCYESDPLGTNVQGYASYLDANAAPMGIVNRSMEWTSPMLSSDNFYYYSASQVGEDIESSELWYDQVTVALQTLADCDITIGDIYYSAASRSFTAPVTVRYAMNASQLSLKLFGVILEDNLSSRQRNYFATLEATGLGEWSAGGQYASNYVNYTFDNVARGVIGETYAGTSGLFPATIEAGENYTTELSGSLPTDIVNDKVDDAKLVVMLIDGNTSKVINAASAYITGVRGGVGNVVADDTEVTSPKGIWTLMGVQLPDDTTLQPGIYIIDGKKTIVK